jgi:hypothetical protein
MITAAMLLPEVSALADPAVVEGTYGSWTVFAATNPKNDKTWYGAIVQSDIGAAIQVECAPPVIQVAPTMHVSVRVKGYLGDGYRSTEYRVDSKQSHEVTGSYSDNSVSPLCDGECKGNDKSHPEVRLLAEMGEGSVLRWRLRTYKYETIDLMFQITGAADAFNYLEGKCRSAADAPSVSKKQPPKTAKDNRR